MYFLFRRNISSEKKQTTHFFVPQERLIGRKNTKLCRSMRTCQRQKENIRIILSFRRNVSSVEKYLIGKKQAKHSCVLQERFLNKQQQMNSQLLERFMDFEHCNHKFKHYQHHLNPTKVNTKPDFSWGEVKRLGGQALKQITTFAFQIIIHN